MIFWIASYPKSGNTWVRVFLANLLGVNDGAADINRLGMFENFDTRQSFDDALGWETSELPGELVNKLRPAVQESLPGSKKRFLKVHEARIHPVTGIALFSERVTAGVIYIIRNPLDIAASFANHLGSDVDTAIKLMNLSDGHLRDNFQIPQPMGSWSWHVESWTGAPNLKVHILRYEDMLRQPEDAFIAACRFADLPSGISDVSRALELSCFEALLEQEKANGFRERPPKCPIFFRSGRAGLWREQLTEAQVNSLVSRHREVMQRFGYLDASGAPASL